MKELISFYDNPNGFRIGENRFLGLGLNVILKDTVGSIDFTVSCDKGYFVKGQFIGVGDTIVRTITEIDVITYEESLKLIPFYKTWPNGEWFIYKKGKIVHVLAFDDDGILVHNREYKDYLRMKKIREDFAKEMKELIGE